MSTHETALPSVVAAVIGGHTRMLSDTFWGYQGIRRMLSAFTKKYDYFDGHCRSNNALSNVSTCMQRHEAFILYR